MLLTAVPKLRPRSTFVVHNNSGKSARFINRSSETLTRETALRLAGMGLAARMVVERECNDTPPGLAFRTAVQICFYARQELGHRVKTLVFSGQELAGPETSFETVTKRHHIAALFGETAFFSVDTRISDLGWNNKRHRGSELQVLVTDPDRELFQKALDGLYHPSCWLIYEIGEPIRIY